MTFEEARQVRMLFGKYQGQTFDEIASTDEGLRYLDWLRGWFEERTLIWLTVREALAVYLSDPAIAADLERVI